ncbi:MAG: hypothetical protein OES46_00140 [Gammaproteobacteria bacterium]|nr:hypothetical protein [Gammaproteobacteria bacterium]
MTTITSRLPSESDELWKIRELEAQNLLALQNRLMVEERDMIGWLCTVHRNKVDYPNAKPEDVKRIQEQLNKASNLISLTYIWALLDEGGFDEHCKWVSAEERLELKAWKHVRHTGAHAPGSRAKRYSKEFEDFMTNRNGPSGLKQNCQWTKSSIDLKDGMNMQFFLWVQEMVKKALGHCANGNVP